MRIELTTQEVKWLAGLVMQEKEKYISVNNQSPHSIYELRRDNMADLEFKLNTAIKKQIERNRRNVR